MKLLVRSLLAALVFAGVYYAWLVGWPSKVAVPQGINQDNVIKMQEYLYGNTSHYPTVILGSSLAAKLRAQVLPPGICNLALRGQSVYEGFELLQRKGQVPRLILLEVNMLDRPPTPGSTHNVTDLCNPVMYALRRWYPGLQARHQPVNEALANGLAVLDRLRPAVAQHIEEKLGVGPAPTSLLVAEDKDYQRPSQEILAVTYAEDNQPPEPVAFKHTMGLLNYYVSYFRKRGSRVVFFEMPTDSVCCQSGKIRYLRQQLATRYPASQLPYLPLPDCGAYRTTDGEHLTDPSAWRYSVVLAQELHTLMPEPAAVSQATAARLP